MLVVVLTLITDNACLYLSLIPWHCTNQRVTETQALIHVNELLFPLFYLSESRWKATPGHKDLFSLMLMKCLHSVLADYPYW